MIQGFQVRGFLGSGIDDYQVLQLKIRSDSGTMMRCCSRRHASPIATSPASCHARVFERGSVLKPCQDTVSTFANHCLAGEQTLGDPFQDSGVVIRAFR